MERDSRLKIQAKAELEILYKIRPHVELRNQDLYLDSLSIHLEEPICSQLLWIRMFKKILLKSKTTLQESTKEDIRKFFPSI